MGTEIVEASDRPDTDLHFTMGIITNDLYS